MYWMINNGVVFCVEKSYREDCSGKGRYLLSKCRCDKLYYGPRCQYKDECVEDGDCGDQGRCIDVHATSAPRKQCYCEPGWFGPACTKRELRIFIYNSNHIIIIIMVYVFEKNDFNIICCRPRRE